MLKFLRRVLFLGLLAAVVYAVWKQLTGTGAGGSLAAVGSQAQPRPVAPVAVIAPVPPAVTAAPGPAPSQSWVEPDDGSCPVSHPVKGKLTSGIFHLPGGQNYERTRADRCYTDTRTAEADGLRQAKR